MTKTSIFFGVLSLMLVAAISGIVWQLTTRAAHNPVPQVNGIADQLGLPGLHSQEDASDFRAKSALLYNPNTDTIAFEQNGFARVPIASITKLMTAMVALDYGISWETPVSINPDEYVIGSRLQLFAGEQVTMRDLFYASLLGSANNATLAYVRQLNVPNDEFVQAMNRKAIELGLEQTRFVEVTGLDKENVSTAYEVAKMANAAFNKYPAIKLATSAPTYSFTVPATGRQHTIKNPNKNITSELQPYLGSKTGYLYEAGYCLVVQGTGAYEDRIAVILGSLAEEWHLVDIDRILHLPTI